MLVLISYDINTQDSSGRKRLRQVAKLCINHGQRVQNSVFECILDNTQYEELKYKLLKIICEDKDSLLFYNLGNKYKTKVECFGAKSSLDIEGDLIF